MNASETDPVEAVVDLSGGGVDYAFDAIGVRQTTETINEVTRPGSMGAGNEGGTAVLIGVPGHEMTLDPRAMLSAHRRYATSSAPPIPIATFRSSCAGTGTGCSRSTGWSPTATGWSRSTRRARR